MLYKSNIALVFTNILAHLRYIAEHLIYMGKVSLQANFGLNLCLSYFLCLSISLSVFPF